MPTTTDICQTAPLDWARDAVEALGRFGPRYLGRWIKFSQRSSKQVEQQCTDAIGKGFDPLADGGTRRLSTGQGLDHSLDAQAAEEVSTNHLLHQGCQVATIGMQKIGEQGMGTLAALTADPLYPDGKPLISRVDPPLAEAPTDQGVNGSTIGMGTAIRQCEDTSRDGDGFGITFCRIGVVCYDDHIGVPSVVTVNGDVRPRRRALSFMVSLPSAVLPLPSWSSALNAPQQNCPGLTPVQTTTNSGCTRGTSPATILHS